MVGRMIISILMIVGGLIFVKISNGEINYFNNIIKDIACSKVKAGIYDNIDSAVSSIKNIWRMGGYSFVVFGILFFILTIVTKGQSY